MESKRPYFLPKPISYYCLTFSEWERFFYMLSTPGIKLPAGVNRNTKIRKVFNLQDFNLARINVGIFIDDKDFQEITLSDAPNYAIGLRAEAGTWVETGDGKYRAYIFLNSINSNGSAVISMLRYQMQ